MPERDLLATANLQPKQLEALMATVKHQYTLFGGAAGPGKSYLVRWWLALRLVSHFQQGFRGVTVGLFCETYRTLHDRQISRMRSEFPGWLGRWHERDSEFRLTEALGGGTIALRNTDDPQKYQSSEWADVAFDELTLQPKNVFMEVKRRMRWPGMPDEHNRFLAATNPGGTGHEWVRKLWIDRDFSGDDEGFDPNDFCYVHATLRDNQYLSKGYEKRFVTEEERRTYVDGDWSMFRGQFFKSWRRELHVCDPFEIPAHWRRWMCVDYGTASPFCALWIAQDPSNGRRFVYGELYARGLTAMDQARLILDAEAKRGPDERIAARHADPSMFWRGAAADQFISPADTYREQGVLLQPAANARVPGWNSVRQALALQEDGLPGLRIFSTCRNLVRSLPLLRHDDVHPEDSYQSPDFDDHAPDALRYGLAQRTPTPLAKRERKIRWVA